MSNLIKVPLIMGTLMTIVLGYLTLKAMDIERTLGNSILLWVALVGIVFVLQLLTQLRTKAGKYGEKVGSDIASRITKSSLPKDEVTEEAPHAPTFLQQACDLIFIGEYVATFFALVPAIAVAYLFNREKGNEQLEIWETILIGILTLLWLIYIETAGRVKLCTPYLPIPLKWLVIPAALCMLYIQIFE